MSKEKSIGVSGLRTFETVEEVRDYLNEIIERGLEEDETIGVIHKQIEGENPRLNLLNNTLNSLFDFIDEYRGKKASVYSKELAVALMKMLGLGENIIEKFKKNGVVYSTEEMGFNDGYYQAPLQKNGISDNSYRITDRLKTVGQPSFFLVYHVTTSTDCDDDGIDGERKSFLYVPMDIPKYLESKGISPSKEKIKEFVKGKLESADDGVFDIFEVVQHNKFTGAHMLNIDGRPVRIG